MSDYLRLNNVFDDWSTAGIFTTLQSLDVPWQDLNIASSLDLLYHGNHGDRIISPMVSKLLDDDNMLDAAALTKLGNAIITLYGTNWNKLYATLSLQYNPISNYDMTETESIDNDTSSTITNTGTVTTDNTVTRTGTVTTDQDNTNSVYGFNSDTAVDADTQALDNTLTNNLTDDTDETVTNNLSTAGTGTNDTERTLTRSGNIGVTTSQQMIQSERDLWLWKFFDRVFADLDSILTLKIY